MEHTAFPSQLTSITKPYLLYTVEDNSNGEWRRVKLRTLQRLTLVITIREYTHYEVSGRTAYGQMNHLRKGKHTKEFQQRDNCQEDRARCCGKPVVLEFDHS